MYKGAYGQIIQYIIIYTTNAVTWRKTRVPIKTMPNLYIKRFV